MSERRGTEGRDVPQAGRARFEPTPRLPIGRYQLHFEAVDAVRLPEYAGSTWRGALGHALKRTVCVTREPACSPCLLYGSCAYAYVFETPPPADSAKMRLYPAAPHPFVLEPGEGGPRDLACGEELAVGLTLFGHANRHLPYLIHALRRAGEEGIGKGKGRIDLLAVGQADPGAPDDWRTVHVAGGPLTAAPPAELLPPPAPDAAAIELHTPLRLQREGHNVGPDDLRFGDLFGNLLRRLSMLTYFHTDTPLETDFAGLTAEARAVEWTERALTWRDWTRYSSRQQTTLQMGGVTGRLAVDLRGHERLWPYLWLGQWTHAGKGTSMGLGRYRVLE
ncbi:MAG: CRISPR system precrRNA processing endoribonuclease RAMP protein Cas6 [Gammaproteobacteria bacterium]|nr:CRISPR system precrRNA processing endoribonuclease RAMP protein Cas6 [Gammaproteobacteria bacterium]